MLWQIPKDNKGLIFLNFTGTKESISYVVLNGMWKIVPKVFTQIFEHVLSTAVK